MTETEWRAEPIDDTQESWRVIGEDGWEIARGLNEPTAHLIAAAKETRDALEQSAN